ncbi:hypothetical protein IFM89_024762 [Coptis chinensis]|uniref:Partial AB-hydrolase lipase domain-containing protein n=1 Tax=Coptis chinensis TaxID=261450 RepID=A0A835GYZ2_9MAGN|nr:hypothetical protein IFM89_024762 [Coptis chinensis]
MAMTFFASLQTTTPDGYILSVQRIPLGRTDQTPGDRIPVLLQHGVLMDGVTWLLNSPDQSLAFILADSGVSVCAQNQTGQKLHYVGHSLGTLLALASFSKEKLLGMLLSAALLSPIAYLGHIPSVVTRAASESYGGQDALSDPSDVQLLLDNLKDHDGDKLVVQYIKDYAQADFVMPVNAKLLVYNPLMDFFQLHS